MGHFGQDHERSASGDQSGVNRDRVGSCLGKHRALAALVPLVRNGSSACDTSNLGPRPAAYFRNSSIVDPN